MTHDEMLKKMHLTDGELRDLLRKFHSFFKSLDKQQQAVVKYSLPKLERAAKTFGPDVTPDNLEDLLEAAGNENGVAIMSAGENGNP